MTTTLRIADSVEGLSDADPIKVERVHFTICARDEFTPAIQQLAAAFSDIGRSVSGSFTAKVNAKNLYRVFPGLRHPQAAMAGYRITNKRGRRKLVEAKS